MDRERRRRDARRRVARRRLAAASSRADRPRRRRPCRSSGRRRGSPAASPAEAYGDARLAARAADPLDDPARADGADAAWLSPDHRDHRRQDRAAVREAQGLQPDGRPLDQGHGRAGRLRRQGAGRRAQAQGRPPADADGHLAHRVVVFGQHRTPRRDQDAVPAHPPGLVVERRARHLQHVGDVADAHRRGHLADARCSTSTPSTAATTPHRTRW